MIHTFSLCLSLSLTLTLSLSHTRTHIQLSPFQIKVSEQGKLLTRLKMMVGSSGVRKAVLTCMAIYLFTVATGFSVISYHAKAILMQAQVTKLKQ